jgi:hypothetical protein
MLHNSDDAAACSASPSAAAKARMLDQHLSGIATLFQGFAAQTTEGR